MACETHCCHSQAAEERGIPPLGRKLKIVGGIFLALLLVSFLPQLSAQWGTRWLVSTSRRTEPWVADTVAELARDRAVVEDFIDFREALNQAGGAAAAAVPDPTSSALLVFGMSLLFACRRDRTRSA